MYCPFLRDKGKAKLNDLLIFPRIFIKGLEQKN